jgi:hypothetical protein
MRELADLRKRFGCRRLHNLLKREKLVTNKKRTERIYRKEKLQIRIRRRKKGAAQTRVELPKAERPNQVWLWIFCTMHCTPDENSEFFQLSTRIRESVFGSRPIRRSAVIGSLEQVRNIVESWRLDCNQARPQT